MASKLICVTTIIAFTAVKTSVGSLVAAPQVLAPAPLLTDTTIDPNPSYSYAYDVQDSLTGDSKGQVESRANGIVKGQYNVADPDGTRRIVDYYADPIHGFNAVVRKVPIGIVAKAAVPVAPVARAVAPAPVPFTLPAPVPRFAAPLVPAPAPLPAVSPYATRAVFPSPAVLPSSPYLAAPALAPAVGRLASPYLAAPAPLPVAPGFAAPYWGAPAAPLAAY